VATGGLAGRSGWLWNPFFFRPWNLEVEISSSSLLDSVMRLCLVEAHLVRLEREGEVGSSLDVAM